MHRGANAAWWSGKRLLSLRQPCLQGFVDRFGLIGSTISAGELALQQHTLEPRLRFWRQIEGARFPGAALQR